MNIWCPSYKNQENKPKITIFQHPQNWVKFYDGITLSQLIICVQRYYEKTLYTQTG
jgi:hypothetical protein